MNLTITGRHLEVSPNNKAYIEKKLAKIKKHFDHIIDVHLTIELEKNNHVAKVNITGEGVSFHAEERQPEFNATIDTLCDILDRNILKYKQKHWNKKHIKKNDA